MLNVSALTFLALPILTACLLTPLVTARVNFDERNAFLLKEIREGHVGPGIFGFELGSVPKALALLDGGRSIAGGVESSGGDDGHKVHQPSRRSGEDDDEGGYTKTLTMTYGNGSAYRCVFRHLVEEGSAEDVGKEEAEVEVRSKARKKGLETLKRKREEQGRARKEANGVGTASGKGQEDEAKEKAREEAAAAEEARRQQKQEEEEEAYFGDGLTIRFVCFGNDALVAETLTP